MASDKLKAGNQSLGPPKVGSAPKAGTLPWLQRQWERNFRWRKGKLRLCRATRPPRNTRAELCDTRLRFIKAVMGLSMSQSHHSDWESRAEPFQLLAEQRCVTRAEIIPGHFSWFRWWHFKTPFIPDMHI